MKVLFAVNNEEISEAIVKKYQKKYKEIISYKNVYYFNAILKEIQKDKSYNRIVVSEDLEQFTNSSYEQMDKFIFEKLDSISDETSSAKNDVPIILICTERRTKSEDILEKLFGIGVYNAIIGNDRSIDEVCRLINKPRVKKEAKTYYQINSDNVGYKAENENDVSEVEIQNIQAHFKRLGKNEAKYLESFENIASQYNDNQLKVICRCLPLSVRAVLEEQSPKYQQVMAFNKSVSNDLRKPKKPEKSGLSQKLLVNPKHTNTLDKPIVIPTSISSASRAKKLTRKVNKPVEPKVKEIEQEEFERTTRVPQFEETQQLPQYEETAQVPQFEEIKQEPLYEEPEQLTQIEDTMTNIEINEPKRRRGRPRKNPEPKVENENKKPKKRGRPRKNQEVQEEIDFDEEQEKTISVPNTEESSAQSYLPGFSNENYGNDYEDMNYEDNNYEENNYEDINSNSDSNYSDSNYSDNTYQENNYNQNPFANNNYSQLQSEDYNNNSMPENNASETVEDIIYSNSRHIVPPQSYEPEMPITDPTANYGYSGDVHVDISDVLQGNKKIAAFVGTSKNGTSFIVNNLAELLSSAGVNVAILDTTKNRNSYYIYTKNEEDLRRTAMSSITNLANGIANGIRVNSNLAVYTSLPNEENGIENVQIVLETLAKSHTLVLIDCDFATPKGYFSAAQEVYLVQTMDVLTIQPLTAFLKDLVSQNILEEQKIRIVINKYVKIRGISEKEIIGGMAYYNDPAMTYQTGLFDKSLAKYIVIPFEEETYTRYLQGLINCEVSLKGYSKIFLQSLKQLGNMLYPIASNKVNYRPPALGNTGGSNFSSSMNNTLDQMKRNY